MVADPSYCCPRCHGPLDGWRERYECKTCGAVYPIIVGIPDFRVCPDPYISLEADREKGRHLDAAATRLSFAELVTHYYEITPEVPPDLASRHQAHHLAGAARGQAMLKRFEVYGLVVRGELKGLTLDLGCGTGGFLAASSEKTMGVDIAFRWLVVGRRQLHDAGIDSSRLVCACADHLPFLDQQFDLVVAENLIEHTEDPAGVLTEVNRVLTPRGAFVARTVNRFAIAPEPHVGVWGVGFLPRRWMDRYVRFVKGIPYEHIHLQSYLGLRRIICSSGLTEANIVYPHIAYEDYSHHSSTKKAIFKLYIRLGELIPFVRPLLMFFGPYLDLVVRPKNR